MPRPVWDPAIFARNDLVISPSQYEDFRGRCPRLWWWGKLQKMPGKDAGPQFLFGNVLHAVAERWLSADEQGRVPEPGPFDARETFLYGKTRWLNGPLAGQFIGNPVDIFPEGWDFDGGVRLSRVDRSKVRRLVEDGIERGVLRRLPGRQIEKKFDFQLMPGIAVIGVLDQHVPGIVEDHKTTSQRHYALGKDRLRKDPKMLLYAAYDLLTYGSTEVVLRLNYFCKDNAEDPPTWSVEVTVSEAEIRETLLEAMIAADEMRELKDRNLQDKDWRQAGEPRYRGACQKYGGCDFGQICGGLMTPEVFREMKA